MLNKINNLLDKFGLSGIRKPLHLALSQSFVAGLFVAIDFIFSKELSVANFGAWKEIFFFLNLGIPLLAFGLPEGYKFFIAKDEDDHGYFESTTSFLLAVTSVLLAVLIILNLFSYFGLFDLGMYYGYSLLFPLPLFAFLLNKTLRFTYVNIGWEEKLTKLSFISTIINMVFIIVGVLLIREHLSILVGLSVLLYFFIFMCPALFYARALKFNFLKFRWNGEQIKKMITYGFPLYLATFVGVFSNNLDKLIVSVTNDDAIFAIFAAGAFEIPLFAMVSAAFAQQVFPRVVALIDKKEELQAKRLWIDTSVKVSLITYPMILLALFFAEEIIYFVYSEAYEDSVVLFKTYLLIGLFRNNSYGVLLAAKEKTKMVTNITLVLLGINLIVSILLYYFFGLLGIVVGTLITNGFMWLIYTVKERLWSLYPKLFFKNKIIVTLLILILLIYIYG